MTTWTDSQTAWREVYREPPTTTFHPSTLATAAAYEAIKLYEHLQHRHKQPLVHQGTHRQLAATAAAEAMALAQSRGVEVDVDMAVERVEWLWGLQRRPEEGGGGGRGVGGGDIEDQAHWVGYGGGQRRRSWNGLV
ncbi:hypothetical protein FN846DRAFT_887190 [Sphaerosporella brunnea]|uniref:Uncharacterized protein n=1 Tax=Sphaerosporella brunnea TaxID=1250544 RepID=A0A5J5F6U5_9PEZI|nr:hypothetical protein FN846DRAFT_887190 [Sphaerosporella brunnea]